MPGYRLERVQVIPRRREEVFGFFADAHNLEAITPPFLRFRVETPRPIAMEAGTLIDYRLRLLGVPFRWRTRIAWIEAPRGFVDEAIRSPYRRWYHTHLFLPVDADTLMVDRVEYELPLGPLGSLARGALLVRRSLDRIFDYRRKVIAERFGPEPALDAASEALIEATKASHLDAG